MPDFFVDCCELGRGRGGLCVQLPELFGFDLPVELERSQVAEERALLRGEPVSLLMQGLQASRGAPRERLRARAVGLLRGQRGGKRQDRERGGTFHGRLATRNYNI